ncbi:hypothetical protein FCH79_16580 [Pseudomonas koreensis]|uniref:hypothetical protein n=1 Tax=Pseudomonas TaxID=286 RepID=UPI000A36E372|nr:MULTISPECIES: hypothetical protein [Pseudomonas]NTZ96899.1 hypothetical protein [Pseudomonas koreensis]
MFKELLEALGRVKSRPLLSVFAALAFSTVVEGGGPIKDPFSVTSLLLPFFLMVSSMLIVSWVLCVNSLNSRLADHDLFSWGPYLGGTILAFCLCVAFWYVSNVPDPINLKLLGSVEFVRMFALYLFAVETINIKR